VVLHTRSSGAEAQSSEARVVVVRTDRFEAKRRAQDHDQCFSLGAKEANSLDVCHLAEVEAVVKNRDANDLIFNIGSLPVTGTTFSPSILDLCGLPIN
jgi:hypothetical protein